jgi:hypothetical protein
VRDDAAHMENMYVSIYILILKFLENPVFRHEKRTGRWRGGQQMGKV